MNLAFDPDGVRSRALLDRALAKSGSYTTPSRLFYQLDEDARHEGFRFNWSAALEHWWDFARAGGVTILGSGDDARAAHPLYVEPIRIGGRVFYTQEILDAWLDAKRPRSISARKPVERSSTSAPKKAAAATSPSVSRTILTEADLKNVALLSKPRKGYAAASPSNEVGNATRPRAAKPEPRRK